MTLWLAACSVAGPKRCGSDAMRHGAPIRRRIGGPHGEFLDHSGEESTAGLLQAVGLTSDPIDNEAQRRRRQDRWPSRSAGVGSAARDAAAAQGPTHTRTQLIQPCISRLPHSWDTSRTGEGREMRAVS